MYDKLCPKFFYYTLRPFLSGYTNLKFTGVKDINGDDIILSNPGGTGGYDPSFQMF